MATVDPPPVERGVLERAVAIYLEKAYPEAPPPEAIRRRLEWPADRATEDLLVTAPFERASNSESGVGAIFALRLGNARYPHMKLQVQAWPNTEGYLLSVNTHDQVLALNPGSRDFEAFRLLQADNQRLKEAIEQAWDQAGLPTFLKYLRSYLETQQNAQGEAIGGG
jgi:hypothetical protein